MIINEPRQNKGILQVDDIGTLALKRLRLSVVTDEDDLAVMGNDRVRFAMPVDVGIGEDLVCGLALRKSRWHSDQASE